MITALALLGYAACAAWLSPALLAPLTRRGASVRAGLAAWLAAMASVVGSAAVAIDSSFRTVATDWPQLTQALCRSVAGGACTPAVYRSALYEASVTALAATLALLSAVALWRYGRRVQRSRAQTRSHARTALLVGRALAAPADVPQDPASAGAGPVAGAVGPASGAAGPAGRASSAAGSADGTSGLASGTAGPASGAAGSASGAAGSASGAAGSASGAAGSADGTAGPGSGAAGPAYDGTSPAPRAARLAARRPRPAAAAAGARAVMLDDPRPAAYCVAGRPAAIVVTSGALTVLDPPQLRAVLAHERAHLAHGHHVLATVTRALAAALPVPLFTRGAAEVARLAEMSADDTAARASGRPALAAALIAIATGARYPSARIPGTAHPGTDSPDTSSPGEGRPGTAHTGTDSPGTDSPGEGRPRTGYLGTGLPRGALAAAACAVPDRVERLLRPASRASKAACTAALALALAVLAAAPPALTLLAAR